MVESSRCFSIVEALLPFYENFMLLSFDLFVINLLFFFVLFGTVNLLQLNLTIQRHAYGRVGNSPPLRQTIFLNIIQGSLATYCKRGIIIWRSPSLRPERQNKPQLYLKINAQRSNHILLQQNIQNKSLDLYIEFIVR